MITQLDYDLFYLSKDYSNEEVVEYNFFIWDSAKLEWTKFKKLWIDEAKEFALSGGLYFSDKLKDILTSDKSDILADIQDLIHTGDFVKKNWWEIEDLQLRVYAYTKALLELGISFATLANPHKRPENLLPGEINLKNNLHWLVAHFLTWVLKNQSGLLKKYLSQLEKVSTPSISPEYFLLEQLLAPLIDKGELDLSWVDKVDFSKLRLANLDKTFVAISTLAFNYKTVYSKLKDAVQYYRGKSLRIKDYFYGKYNSAEKITKDNINPILNAIDFNKISDYFTDSKHNEFNFKLLAIHRMLLYVRDNAEIVVNNDDLRYNKKIELPEIDLSSPYSWYQDQKNALEVIDNDENPIVLLQGSAGTGKSQVITHLYNQYVSQDCPVTILCPTGKAANNLKQRLRKYAEEFVPTVDRQAYLEAINDNIATYHAFFKWFADSNFTPSYSNLPNRTTPVLIFEETSMLDENILFYALSNLNLAKIGKIIFIGDSKQLPAIDKHSKLMAYLTSDYCPIEKVELTENKRVKNGAALVEWLNEFNKGKFILPSSDLNAAITFTEVPYNGYYDIVEKLKFQVANHIKLGQSYSFITFANRDVDSINAIIADYLAGIGFTKDNKEIIFSKNERQIKWRIGEKLLVNQNMRFSSADNISVNSQKVSEYYLANGDFVTLEDFSAILRQGNKIEKKNCTSVIFDSVDSKSAEIEQSRQRKPRYEITSLTLKNLASGEVVTIASKTVCQEIIENLKLGYASTIHKMQGSEVDYVYYFFNHNLYRNTFGSRYDPSATVESIYTAMSRAQQQANFYGNVAPFNLPKVIFNQLHHEGAKRAWLLSNQKQLLADLLAESDNFNYHEWQTSKYNINRFSAWDYADQELINAQLEPWIDELYIYWSKQWD